MVYCPTLQVGFERGAESWTNRYKAGIGQRQRDKKQQY